MSNSAEERHRYGQHYTPREVALLLASFAIRSAGDTVLDPSCGDGRLLEASRCVKAGLLSTGRGRAELTRDLFGVDRSRPAVKIAARTGAVVAASDFFDVEPGARLSRSVNLPALFDALVANPPYIRQEIMGARDKRRIKERLDGDRACAPEIFWPAWSGRSDIYVYFFARSTRFLKAGGRLAFLTASSWLDAGYGAALRQFLLNNFRVVAIIESVAEGFFRDASINTAITVLERETDAVKRDANHVRFVQLLSPLAGILGRDDHLQSEGADEDFANNCSDALARRAIKFARIIERASSSTTAATHRIRVINQVSLSGESSGEPGGLSRGWGLHLRADEVFFEIVGRGGARLEHLSSLARVRYGVKTGANEFFYLAEAREQGKKKQAGPGRRRGAEASLLSLGDVASVRRGLTTGANEFFYLKQVTAGAAAQANANGQETSPRKRLTTARLLIPVEDRSGKRHAIEAEFLSPVVFSLKEIPGIFLERRHASRLFFNCPLAPAEIVGTGALKYIKSGERAGYDLRPTCASRDPWHAAARRLKPAPIIFPSKVGERWVVAINRARVFEDKKLYGIFPARGVSAVALAALLNSTWARYFAEMTCRQMTGAQAIADIDVAVAEQILLPDPRNLSPVMKKRLEGALMALARRPVLSIFEEVERADRRKLDELVLEAIGFTDGPERKNILSRLYRAMTALVRSRISRGQGKDEA